MKLMLTGKAAKRFPAVDTCLREMNENWDFFDCADGDSREILIALSAVKKLAEAFAQSREKERLVKARSLRCKICEQHHVHADCEACGGTGYDAREDPCILCNGQGRKIHFLSEAEGEQHLAACRTQYGADQPKPPKPS